ncbi:MAG: hypothetical protein K9J12_14025, partial [Melioribacteraceae bacterium]|nr:hypothetical protein [Melioribacteraceae bacterium]
LCHGYDYLNSWYDHDAHGKKNFMWNSFKKVQLLKNKNGIRKVELFIMTTQKGIQGCHGLRTHFCI